MDMDIINKIPGGSHPAGIGLLYELVKESPTPRIVELGSFVGKSAIIMALALRKSGRKGTIICVDRFKKDMIYWGPGHAKFECPLRSFWEYAKMACVEDYLITIKAEIGPITRALKGKFGMIYIDGGHTIEQVIPNALWAWDNLVEGGILLFDDYDIKGTHKYKDVKIGIDCLLSKWDRQIYKQAALMVAIKK